jgi:hypothetical protein
VQAALLQFGLMLEQDRILAPLSICAGILLDNAIEQVVLFTARNAGFSRQDFV